MNTEEKAILGLIIMIAFTICFITYNVCSYKHKKNKLMIENGYIQKNIPVSYETIFVKEGDK